MTTHTSTNITAPSIGAHRSHRWSFVVRLSSMLALVLGLSLVAPAASATPLNVPAYDQGGPGGGSLAQLTVSRLFNEVFTGQRGEVCTELMTAEATHQTPTGQYQGPDGFNTYANLIWTAFPDAVFTMDEVREADGAVTVRWSMTGTHLGPLDGQAATGNRVVLQGLAYFAFEGDRIAASWIAYDRLGMVSQIESPAASGPTCTACEELP